MRLAAAVARLAAFAAFTAFTLVPFSSVRADEPIDVDLMPRYGRYASTQSFLQGGEADRLGLEAERAPIPGAADNAVEIDPEPDADGNPKWVHFRLEVVEVQEEVYPGQFVTFWVYAPLGRSMGSAARTPSPTLRVQQGEKVLVTLYNTHYLPHTIHFHGMDQPAAMDGVPDMSGPWIEPGQSFTYTFEARQAGTFFYHCHVHEHVHVPMGLGGMVIVEPRRPHNHFARLIPGAGRIPVLAKATAEHYQREYSLVYLDIDDRLNRIPALQGDVREVERRMHRDYDTTRREPDIFLLNGRSFPFTLRDTPLLVQPNQHTLLRILNMGGRPIYFHPHGHHPTLTGVDGRAVPAAAQLVRDTFDVGPSQRIDLDLDTGSNSPNAAGPGHWMVHDHTPAASTNKGIGPGGNHTAIIYVEGGDAAGDAGAAEHVQHQHARYFDADYYAGLQPVFDPAPASGPAPAAGLAPLPAPASAPAPGPARGPVQSQRSAPAPDDYPHIQRGAVPTPVPRLDVIDAQRHRPVASACETHARSTARVVLKAGRAFSRPGEVYAFEPRRLHVERCQEVELVLENLDAIRHDLMIPGLVPMLTVNFVGPGTVSTRFITPDADVTLPFHCHVPAHDKVGMLGELVVGKGSPPARLLPVRAVQPAAAKLHDGVGVVVAVLPRQGRVIIKHDDIKGYMAAMEMGFAVASPALLQGIAEGDRIAFKVNPTTATVTEVRLLDRPR